MASHPAIVVAVQAAQGTHEAPDPNESPLAVTEPTPSYTRWFTERTFELLAGLQANPKRDFYLQHKEEFRSRLEDPFKALFARVVALLPTEVLDRMESEKNVFARILKNDYGRGGAWPFYWGALYPKDGKRIGSRHAQRRFRMWREKAGISTTATPHSCRHRFAMQLYERTGDVLLVRRALGHRSISSTLVYARASEERLRAAL